jgi:hypothetical protein
MTVAEFRNNFELTRQWAGLLASNDILRVVLFDVMENAHPARFAITGDNNADVSPTRAAIELGFTRGFSKYADTLRLLSKATAKTEEVGEPTYQQEEPVNAT